MDTLIIAFQFALLMPALPLAVVSQRTSRTRRNRHGRFVALAVLLGVAAMLLALLSLSVAFGSEEPVDLPLHFAPPLLTLLACAWVVRRGLGASAQRSRRGRGTKPQPS